MQVNTKIFIEIILLRILHISNYCCWFTTMIQRKPGRPSSEDKREPFNFRLRKSVLKALKDRAKDEQRAMNTVAENILEKELLK